MGVVVPKVDGQNLKLSTEDRGLGLIGGAPYIDEAADSYSLLIEKVVKAAEMEATLKRLLEEIEATKRRVNALEFKVIPEMKEAQTFIQLRLEEMEREEIPMGQPFNKDGRRSTQALVPGDPLKPKGPAPPDSLPWPTLLPVSSRFPPCRGCLWSVVAVGNMPWVGP